MKKKGFTAISRFDSFFLAFIFVAVFVISLTVRFKILDGYMSYDFEWPMLDTPNLFTHYKLMFLLGLVLASSMVFLYRMWKYRPRIRRDYVPVCTALILTTATVTTFNNPVGLAQLWGFYTRTHGLLAYVSLFTLLFLVSNLYPNRRSILALLHGINAFSILMAIIGCFQFVGWDIYRTSLYRFFYLPAEYRNAPINSDLFPHSAAALFPHFNYYGAWCSIIFPLLFAFAVRAERRRDQTLFGLGALFVFTGVITSVSQGALFTLCITLLLLPIAFLKRNTAKRFSVLYVALGGIATIMFTSFDFLTRNELAILASAKQPMLQRLLPLFFLTFAGIFLLLRKILVRHRRGVANSIAVLTILLVTTGSIWFLNKGVESHQHLFSDRGYVWLHTFRFLENHPLTGCGPDNMYYVFPHENPDAHLYSNGQIFEKPHNMYLQTAMDTGLVGLVGFLALFTLYLFSLIRANETVTDSVKQTYLRASILIVTAYLLQGFVNDNHLSIQPMLYTVLGVGMALSKTSHTSDPELGCDQPSVP